MRLKLTRYFVVKKKINQEERIPVMCRESHIPTNFGEGDAELEEVELGEHITSIRSGAFQGCTSLTTVTIHDSLKRIDANAFAGCAALQDIVLPENLDEVDCWFDNRGVAKITLPNPSSAELVENLKKGYPMDFYYKGEFREDYWD